MKKLLLFGAIVQVFTCMSGLPFQLAQITLLPISCDNPALDGSVQIFGSGGTEPYTFTFNGGNPAFAASNFASFSFPSSVTSLQIIGVDSSIPKQKPITVSANPLVSSLRSISFFLVLRCNGIQITYDTDVSVPQSVQLEGPNFKETQPLSNFGSFPADPTAGLSIGHYKLTFTPKPIPGSPQCNKPIVFEFDITQSPLSIRAQNNAECSARENQGSLTVIAQGGAPNFTYSISGPSGIQTQVPTPNRKATFTGLANGVYTVTVTDSATGFFKPDVCTQTTQVTVNSRRCKRKVLGAVAC